MENTVEKQIEINAPVSQVWKALTDAKQFAQWFGVKLEGSFIAGKSTFGVNDYKNLPMEFKIKEIKPETYFSYAWTPYNIDQTFDYSKEEPTLVEFFLETTKTGTLLKVKESGFSKITASRRAEAFKMHAGGWEAQLKNIKEFLV